MLHVTAYNGSISKYINTCTQKNFELSGEHLVNWVEEVQKTHGHAYQNQTVLFNNLVRNAGHHLVDGIVTNEITYYLCLLILY